MLPEGLDDVFFCSHDQAIAQADIVAVLVKHKQFARIDRSILKDKIVLDFVNAF
jgi:predicted dinucleotide-binding enzyme